MIGVLWIAAALFFQGQTANTAPTFKVSGTIVREDNRAPDSVLNADRILLRGNGASMVLDIEASGAFEFTRVRPGSYEVVVGPAVTMDPLKVVVTDRDVTGVRVVVPNRVALRGTVFVDGGGPFPRFQLLFTRLDNAALSDSQVAAAAGRTFTATLSPGRYRISPAGLPAGYSLKSITSNNTDVLTRPMELASGDPPSMEVTLGVASPPPWVKVSGRIAGVNEAGAPSSVSMTGPAAAEALSVPVINGAFEFSRVLPGAYTLLGLPLTALSASAELTVGGANVTNVELRAPQPREISGNVVIQGDVPMPRLAFSVGPAGSAAIVQANPQPDGSFTISLPEGEHKISVVPGSLPAGYAVSSFTGGAADLMKNPLRLAATGSPRLSVHLDASSIRPVNVSGRVQGLLTTKGVRVVLANPILPSTEAAVEADGSFRFSKVIPGNYNARLSLSGISAAAGVVVGTRDVNDLVIVYPREFVVTGHMIVEGGGAADLSNIVVDAKPAGGGPAVTGSVNNTGVIMLNVKDGEYNISVRNAPAGYQVQSIMYGTTDLQKQPLRIDGPVTWEIIVRIKP